MASEHTYLYRTACWILPPTLCVAENLTHTPAAFLGVERIFDRVSVEGAISCLRSLDLIVGILTFIIHYLSDRSYAIKLGSSLSSSSSLKDGLPQSSVLRPSLLNVVIATVSPLTPVLRLVISTTVCADDACIWMSGKGPRRWKQAI